MRVVLSRKGFDDSSGGCASPILPDGTMLSLPIPGGRKDLKYEEIIYKGYSYKKIIEDLYNDSKHSFNKTNCHLDPDLICGLNPNADKSWGAAFGQVDSSQTHLNNQGITKEQIPDGVLFLFFGWFKPVSISNKGFEYLKNESGFQSIYGYMFVDRILSGDGIKKEFPWHPHSKDGYAANNSLYVAKKEIKINDKTIPGYGTFKYNEKLKLTKEGMSRSRWDYNKLPEGVKEGRIKLSYHPNACRDDYFQSAGRGQEFVFTESETVTNWALSLINDFEINL